MIRIIPFILLVVIFNGCVSNVSTSIEVSEVDATLQSLLGESLEESYGSTVGLTMTVVNTDLDWSWSGSTGHDSHEKDQEVEVDQPFRIASVTKTFVATAILRLHEERQLSVFDPITKYISSNHIDILKQDGYAVDSITVIQCLRHTSGLFDYAMDGPDYIKAVKADPHHEWTRTEQIQFAMKHGDAIGYPGERYRYSDTGYVLLGEIIERLTDTTLAAGLRVLLPFDSLKMNNTWLEWIETPPNPQKDLVHRYFHGDDASGFSPTIDLYGGGGLISTTTDLAAFMSALFNGAVFKGNETLNLMLSKPEYDANYNTDKDERYKDYRCGLWEINMYGYKGYMHSGLWGTGMIHIKDLNTTIAVNGTKGWWDRLVKKTVLVTKNIKNRSND